MTVLTKRVQVLFPEQLWQNLVQQAQVQNRSVAALIRDAVEQIYFAETKQNEQEERARIVTEMIAMELPVADWQQMERESMELGWIDE